MMCERLSWTLHPGRSVGPFHCASSRPSHAAAKVRQHPTSVSIVAVGISASSVTAPAVRSFPTRGRAGRARTPWRSSPGRRRSSGSSARTSRPMPLYATQRSHNRSACAPCGTGTTTGPNSARCRADHEDRHAEAAVARDGVAMVGQHVVVGRRVGEGLVPGIRGRADARRAARRPRRGRTGGGRRRAAPFRTPRTIDHTAPCPCAAATRRRASASSRRRSGVPTGGACPRGG